MGLMQQVIWQLLVLCTIAVTLAVPGSSGFRVPLSLEPSSLVPPIEAQTLNSVVETGLLQNGSILQSPPAPPPVESPPLHQTIEGPPSFLSPGQLPEPPPGHAVAAAAPEQQPHDSAASPFIEPQHNSAPPLAAETPHDRPRVSTPPPSAEASHESTPPPAAEASQESTPPPAANPLLVSSPPPASDSSHVSSVTPVAAPPHTSALPQAAKPPEAVALLIHAEPPQTSTASPPPEPPPFLPSSSPIVTAHGTATPSPLVPPHVSSVAPLPHAEPPQTLTVSPPPEALQLPSSPPIVTEHGSATHVSSEPPHVLSEPAQPVLSRAPPPTFKVPSHASSPPPFTLPLPLEPPPFLASPPPSAEPPHISILPLAAKAPQAVSPQPVAEPPSLTLPPPSEAQPSIPSQPSAVPPGPPPASAIYSPPITPNISSSPPQLVPSHESPPNLIAPSHALVPPPVTVPLSPESPPIFPSPFPAVPPHASATQSPPMPPHEISPLPQLSPPYKSPPTDSVVPPPLTVPVPQERPPIPPLPAAKPPHASALQSPPKPPPVESSPLPQVAPPNTSPTTIMIPPPMATPPRALSAPPPIQLPHTLPPPSSTIPGANPPHASLPPPFSMHPLVPPPLVIRSPISVPPPVMVPAHGAYAPPPSVQSHSSVPRSPAIQGAVPVVPPIASQRKETPAIVSPEPAPSSRASSGAPLVHPVMPGSSPPISQHVEAPKHSAPFLRSNASDLHSPPLSAPPPKSSPVSSGDPVVAPPGSFPKIAPSEPKFGRRNETASGPVSSRLHPPSIGSHYSPLHSPDKGSHSSVPPPSTSTHKHLQPRDNVRSPGPSSALVSPPAPSQGRAKSLNPVSAPKSSPVSRHKYHPPPPHGQEYPVALVPSRSPTVLPDISPALPPILRTPPAHSIPFLSPKISPSGSSTRNTKRPLAPAIRALPPPPPNQDCAYLTCPEPFSNTPPGSPCGCVWPMQVGLRLSVPLYTFFPLVSELATEIAAGLFMKQSQVRVMGANAASQQPEKTIVLVDLVPLHEKFDNTTASFTFQRFWHKQVAIDKSIFGDYDVLYVRYPGLPPSPPMAPADMAVINGMPYSVGDPNGNKLHPLGVDVSKQRQKHRLNGSLIAVIVFSATVGVLICCAAAWVLIIRHRSQSNKTSQSPRALASLARSSGPAGHSTGSGPSSSLSFGSSLATYTGTAKTFSASEIEKATDNFNPSRILGEGGFGLVYHGILEDETSIAVKVLKRDDQQGGREFLAEVEMLSRLHHRNLVKLIGICIDDRMRSLVYELIPNGSVESHLHGTDKETAPLDWPSRMKIALGAARGLAYLHEDSSPRVIHRDFKSSNILLEDDFTPKVSDFGLARTAMDEENRHISTRVMGTFGYVAPEYAMTGHLLVKSDVYSYGVVLLELLTGRKPVDMSQPPGQENLVAWTRPFLTNKEGLESIIDSSLGSDVPLESVAKVAAIASMCVQPEVSHRPFMGEVVQALKLVCNECDDSKDGDSRNHSHENLSMDFDAKVDPLSGDTPDPLQSQFSLNSYLSGHDVEKGLSVSEIFSSSARLGRQASSSFRRHSASGPLRTARGPRFWQKIRRQSQGSVSEHGIMYRLWAGSH